MGNDSKKLSEFLSGQVRRKDVYTSDQQKTLKRQNRGYYSRSSECFDFIFLINNWVEVVGELLGKNSIPQKLQRDTLFVITKHPIFNQELNMMTREIIQKIEEKIPALKNRIKKIKFSNANFSAEEFQEKVESKVKKEEPQGHKFSPHFRAKQAKANELFADIEDDEIRELLSSLFIKRF
tara:strand:+ start:107815 stop:108354 length:540 start_codon:yes stop_codon:yes gene_type:complete